MKPVRVTVFTTTSSEHGLHVGEVGPQNPDEDCADGSCDPTSGPVVVDEAVKLKKCVDEIKTALGDSVSIEVIDYEDTSSLDRGMELVNQALASAGTDTIDSPERFTMFVNSSAPLILVQDKIASTGIIP
ncbi:MAG: hypothetical protein ACXAEF_14095, partial [Candidatus Thorarchaeota archaeon]